MMRGKVAESRFTNRRFPALIKGKCAPMPEWGLLWDDGDWLTWDEGEHVFFEDDI